LFFNYRFKSATRQGFGISSTDKDAWYYNMHHKYRGKAIIFNHEHFQVRDLKSRAGTGLDCINLEASLKNLGFDVTPYVDLTLDELDKKLDHCTYTFLLNLFDISYTIFCIQNILIVFHIQGFLRKS